MKRTSPVYLTTKISIAKLIGKGRGWSENLENCVKS